MQTVSRVAVAVLTVAAVSCSSPTSPPPTTTAAASPSGWVAVIDTGSTLRIVEWDGASALPPGRVVAVDRDRQASSSDWPGMNVTDELAAQQWGYRRVGADRPQAFDAAGVTVAILDTGVDVTHPDLEGVVDGSFNARDGTADVTDDNGHGTHVAGIVAAGHNSIGIDGAAPQVHLLAVKVLDANGVGDHSDIARGIVWAVDHGASVINLSLGGPETSTILAAAVEYAAAHDVVVVAAAGNGALDGNEPSYPAALDQVIGVGAVGPDDRPAIFSNTGPYVDVAAPGIGIVSTIPGGYGWLSGTSQAAPFVAAAAARLRAARPELNAAQVTSRIEATAYDIGEPGVDDLSGYGVVDVAALAGLSPTGPSETPAGLFAPVDVPSVPSGGPVPSYPSPSVPSPVLHRQVSIMVGPGPVPYGSSVPVTVFAAGHGTAEVTLRAPGDQPRRVTVDGHASSMIRALSSGPIRAYIGSDLVASAPLQVVPVIRVTALARRSGTLAISGSVVPEVSSVSVEALTAGSWTVVGTIRVHDGRFDGTVPATRSLYRLEAAGGVTAPFHA